jgi:hypothetical protein
MIRTSLLLGVLLAGTAAPAAAQGDIHPGQTLQGELSSSDRVLSDGTHYDLWRFRGQAGHVYVVTLRSYAFDAYLYVGSIAKDSCNNCETDNNGAGGTDSRVAFRADGNRTYEIRANSLLDGETGEYMVELEDLGEGQRPPRADVGFTHIRSGPAVDGELTTVDAQAADDSYYDLYVYRGRGGKTITISLSSPEFDTCLVINRVVDGELEKLESNDNGPAGTDSFLRVTLPEEPVVDDYVIRVSSRSGGKTGVYTLRVTLH